MFLCVANLSGKISEVKLWGRGGNSIRHRSVSCAGKQIARRSVNRAERKAAKQSLASYAADTGYESILIGEDADAHVAAYEAAETHFYSQCPADCSFCGNYDYEPSCSCVLCLADNGIISWASALSIYAQQGAPCNHDYTPEDFGCSIVKLN